MLVCFIEQIGVGGESIKQKGVSLVEYLLAWPVLGRGCDNIFFFFSASIHRWAVSECLPVS